MKNLLRKLGVFGLIVALITPYIYIPKVNAATTTDGCTNHLQTYLFLDASRFYTHVKNGEKIMPWLESKAASDKGGYQTWANFPYAFSAASDEKIVINSVTKNDLLDTKDLKTFWEIYNERLKNMSSSKIKVTNEIGNIFVEDAELSNNNFTKLSKYDDVTVIMHGMWSNLDANGEKLLSKLEEIDVDKGIAKSLQTILAEKGYADEMKTYMKNAKFTNNSFESGSANLNSNGADYFQDLVEGKMEQYTYTEDDQKYISLAINRTLGMTSAEVRTALNKYVFGYGSPADVKGIYFTQNDANKIYNSYDGLRTPNYGELANLKYDKQPEVVALGTTYAAPTENDVDFWTDVSYYWPAVLNVEYQVCPTSSDGGNNPTQSWKLVYNSNVSDTSVTNMPNNQNSINIGTNATVDSKVPVRDGYAFKGWCKGEKECTSPLKSGDKVTSPTSPDTITLYAQWGSTEEGSQRPYGVVSYIIGFAAVGLVAGGIYYISRKKNLFKQI